MTFLKSAEWERSSGELLPVFLLVALAFAIRFMGGAWETKWDNDAYMARQAEYIYSFGHPAVPDPFSSAPLYQPGMAYLLALVGRITDLVPYKFALPGMVISEGLVPPCSELLPCWSCTGLQKAYLLSLRESLREFSLPSPIF